MAVVIYDIGAFRLLASHIYDKDNRGLWWFRRRIPANVAKLYPDNKSGWLRFTLKTRDKAEAAKKADVIARQQDALWKSYRSGELEHGPEEVKAAVAYLASYGLKPGEAKLYAAEGIEPDRFISDLETMAGIAPLEPRADGKKYQQWEIEQWEKENAQRWETELPPVHKLAAEMFYGAKVPVFLSDALKEFQALKVQDPGTKSELDRVRVVNEFIARYGDLSIEHYTRDNANDFVRHLLEERKNKTASVRRRINSISAVFNLMISEGKLSKSNIFNGLHIKGYGQDAKTREPFTLGEVRTLQSLCLEKDDELR